MVINKILIFIIFKRFTNFLIKSTPVVPFLQHNETKNFSSLNITLRKTTFKNDSYV